MKTELDGHTIHVYCDDPALTERLNALPACQWDEGNKRWMMLLTLDAVRTLKGMGFDLCPELRRYWIRETRNPKAENPAATGPASDGIHFTVPGPLYPYKRMTRNEIMIVKLSKREVSEDLMPTWRRLQDYRVWKARVSDHAQPFRFARSPKKKLFMHVRLCFETKKHGNPDNYWKSIAEAVFASAKYVGGSFDYCYDAPARAEVVISEEPVLGAQEGKEERTELQVLLDEAF